MWSWTSLERLGQDVRYGWRTLCKNPLFAAMAVLSLALGIGANTAIYSVMDAMMIRALPVRSPGELVILNWRAKQETRRCPSHNGSNYDEPGGGRTSRISLAGSTNCFAITTTCSRHFSRTRTRVSSICIVHGQAEIGAVEFVSEQFLQRLGNRSGSWASCFDSDNAAAHRR